MSIYACSFTPDCAGPDGRVRRSDLYRIIVDAIGLHMNGRMSVGDGFRPMYMAGCAVEYGRSPLLHEKVVLFMNDGEQDGRTFTVNVKVTDSDGSFIASGVADWYVCSNTE